MIPVEVRTRIFSAREYKPRANSKRASSNENISGILPMSHSSIVAHPNKSNEKMPDRMTTGSLLTIYHFKAFA